MDWILDSIKSSREFTYFAYSIAATAMILSAHRALSENTYKSVKILKVLGYALFCVGFIVVGIVISESRLSVYVVSPYNRILFFAGGLSYIIGYIVKLVRKVRTSEKYTVIQRDGLVHLTDDPSGDWVL